MQCLEVNGAVRPLYGSLGVKGLKAYLRHVSVQVCRFQGEQDPGLKKIIVNDHVLFTGFLSL
jgi:hypothetical protein